MELLDNLNLYLVFKAFQRSNVFNIRELVCNIFFCVALLFTSKCFVCVARSNVLSCMLSDIELLGISKEVWFYLASRAHSIGIITCVVFCHSIKEEDLKFRLCFRQSCGLNHNRRRNTRARQCHWSYQIAGSRRIISRKTPMSRSQFGISGCPLDGRLAGSSARCHC